MIQGNISLYDSLFICCEKQYFQGWNILCGKRTKENHCSCFVWLIFLSKIEISFEEHFSSIFCKSFTKQVSLLTFDNFSLISTRVADNISFIIGVANKCCQLQLTYLLMRLAFNGT